MQYRLVPIVSAIVAVLLTALWFGAMIPTCNRINNSNRRISALEQENRRLLNSFAQLSNKQSSIQNIQGGCLELAEKAKTVIEETKKLQSQIEETAKVCESVCCRKRNGQ